ncbi:MAG: class I SAM-dependent methyltransferase [Actinomycetota bacterium]|nr:class I SAM-dependent methyltransferase [Actinomycetota bacterium]
MTGTGHRFYGDLATWWPLISPPEDYETEAAFARGLLTSASGPVRRVLELGSGGGHNARHLLDVFELTLVDLAEPMLEVSRRLNPDARHVQGDMRTVRLGSTFDAVFLHDAVDYMTNEHDLRAAMVTAHTHCRPGGVAVFLPDHTTESFEEGADHGGTDGPDGRAVRYLEWTTDPDPADTQVTTEYVFVLREPDGSTETVHETHTTGLFPTRTWQDLLADVGFAPVEVVEEPLTDDPDDDRRPRSAFVAHRR